MSARNLALSLVLLPAEPLPQLRRGQPRRVMWPAVIPASWGGSCADARPVTVHGQPGRAPIGGPLNVSRGAPPTRRSGDGSQNFLAHFSTFVQM